jgi:hypothetical protein
VILDFLAANAEQAFTPKEIHERTDVARGSVGGGPLTARRSGPCTPPRGVLGHRRRRGHRRDADLDGGHARGQRQPRSRRRDEWGPGVEADDQENT